MARTPQCRWELVLFLPEEGAIVRKKVQTLLNSVTVFTYNFGGRYRL